MELSWGQLDFGPTLLDIETEMAEIASSERFWKLGMTLISAAQTEKRAKFLLLAAVVPELRALWAIRWTNERIQFLHDLVRGTPSGNLPTTEGFPRTIQGRQDFLSCAGDAAFCRANWRIAYGRSILVGETSDPYEHKRLALG